MQTYGCEGGAALLAEVVPASQPRELGAGLVVVAHLARVGVLLECELALGLVVAEELAKRCSEPLAGCFLALGSAFHRA